MWTIKRPNGTIYTRNNLDSLKVSYGFDKEGLENLGWVFKFTKGKTKPKFELPVKEEFTDEDD